MSDVLTSDEREELEKLRAENAQPKQTLKEQAAAEAEAESRKPTHYLLLANGECVESQGTSTHFHGMPVVSSTPIPDDLTDYENYKKEQADEAQ